jgi:hypothetical protein
MNTNASDESPVEETISAMQQERVTDDDQIANRLRAAEFLTQQVWQLLEADGEVRPGSPRRLGSPRRACSPRRNLASSNDSVSGLDADRSAGQSEIILQNPAKKKHHGSKICSRCEKVLVELPSKCSRCKQVYYCNRHCQKQHWKHGHKKECKEDIASSATPRY